MADTGREQRMEALFNRGVEALEKIASDPVIEYETGPPICPHCGHYDPEIATPATDGLHGLLSELAISALCMNCERTFVVVIESYSMHRTPDTAIVEIKERKERNERAGNENSTGN
jgi:hypothetical protein